MEKLATPAEVADALGIPVKTLAQWCYYNKGPKWTKVGRHCRYDWRHVNTWLEANRQGEGMAA